MKIVITNVYSHQNKGDAGIVVSMIQALNKTFNHPDIQLVSLYPEDDKGKYDSSVTVLPPILRYNEKLNKYGQALYNTIITWLKFIQYSMGRFTSHTERAIQDADLIISCGGGYMQSYGIKKLFTSFIYHYIQLLCARKSKKRYIIFAQTIGPFDPISKKLCKKILRDAKLVLVRENISYEYVRNNFCLSNLHLTSDAAFLLESMPVDYVFDKDAMCVGLTARNWFYPGCKNRQEKNNQYINAISSVIDSIISDYNAHIYLMPQCIGPGSDNDLIITREIYSRVKNKSRCTKLEEDFAPGELKYLYSQMDFLIGTRMHSNIFALAEYVPCLAISYDYKTDGIMSLVGLNDYVVNINDVSKTILVDTFKRLYNDDLVVPKLKEKIDIIKDEAAHNYEMIKRIVEKDSNI